MDDYEKFQELLDCCLAEAIQNSLLPTDEVLYKSFCRAYSTKFATPLYLVFKMDPKEVIQTMLDDKYVGSDVLTNVEEMLEQIYTLEDPDYKKQKEIDMGDFAKAAALREQERIKKNQKAEAAAKKAEPPPKKQGGFDASKLNMKNEG